MTSKVIYKGDLRNEAIHLQSGTTIITDAPIDNKGKGEAFSPTDLLATSLGACMLTIIGIAAQSHEFDIQGAECDITKIMGTEPRRVTKIIAKLTFNAQAYSDKQKAIIEKSALTCPVFFSLHPDIEKEISFEYL